MRAGDGAEPAVVDSSDRPDESLAALSETLSALTGVVLGDEMLDLIVSLALSVIRDADGASVSLARGGGVVTANATSDLVRELDGAQYDAGRGPCIDAINSGERQYATGDALASRWPEFGAAALAAGVVTMLSTPLYARDASVGALNLYSQTAHAFDEASTQLATLFALHAGAVLANVATYADAESKNANLLEALATRQVIGQAMGIIMAHEHCSSDEAFDILRRASQHANVKLRDVAREYVRSTEPGAVAEP